MRMGHAMVRPTRRIFGGDGRCGRLAPPGLYLANSDLSGLSLFEEAQFRGVSAARAVLSGYTWRPLAEGPWLPANLVPSPSRLLCTAYIYGLQLNLAVVTPPMATVS